MTGNYPPPPVRRKSKAPRRILITLLVLVVLLVAADRIGDLVAENYAGDKLQQSQSLPNKPDVDINGFPFLTQAASKEFDDVTVTATDVPLRGTPLELSKVVVALDHLTVTDSFSRYHVEHATAVATTSYQSLGSTLGIDLSYAGDGKVKASKKITLLGFSFTPTVTARAELVDGALRFVGTQANGLGAFSGALTDVVDAVFGTGVPLQGIPFDITVQKLSLTPDGLRLDLSGNDLSYTR